MADHNEEHDKMAADEVEVKVLTEEEIFRRMEIGVQAICEGLINCKTPNKLVIAVTEKLGVSLKTGWKWYKRALIRLSGDYRRDTRYKATLAQIAVQRRISWMSQIHDKMAAGDISFSAGMKLLLEMDKDTCALLGLYPDKNINVRHESKGDGKDVSPEEIAITIERIREKYSIAREALTSSESATGDDGVHSVHLSELSGELASQDPLS